MKMTTLDLFFDDVTANASGTTNSAVLDWRMNGADRTKDLVIPVYLRNAGLQSAGSATIKLQGSDNGTDWSDIVSYTKAVANLDADNCLVKIPLAGLALKQFVRLAFTVGTAFTVAAKLFAGLDCDTDYDIDTTHVDMNRDGLKD